MLKKLIQRLLDSRTTPSEAAHNAMPSGSKTTITPLISSAGDSVAEATNFTATTDGYLSARGTTSTTSSRLVVMCYARLYAFGNQTETTIAGTVPLAKGQSASVQFRNAKNIVIEFYDAIGGGVS